ncbi:5'-nucleotidase /3'-nucleotidase /exopolyphosphatase [Parasphingorhabdus marina DSM 22363]|uniref:5'-nucleotidase SurE n=1 Tax=Parasphingorhabdus marina DSM 22363 TaxID=1123272 RepID=A0A1N6D622_9SPHN|nr:5'/3'-nucleotidase SurE [Parasphingorhabdus marina]SIN66146.1 5'-nucleotidase /3'-nucleotidase /exopolyphosphatase [Parasphingorhabdus marina DSM 22363]
MRILLTNDDGFDAPGMKVLLDIAQTLSNDLWIVAPSEEKSGAGHSLTLTRPLRIRQRGDQQYSVDGTPTDSVMMAVAKIMKDGPPDLILSGVNRGANLGEDVTYSGTVSAAMEGALAGIPSIALSQCYARGDLGNDVPFDAALHWGEKVLRPLIKQRMDHRTLVNINFPAGPADDVKGVRVVSQGIRDYGRLQIVSNRDPRGFEYHWFGLGPMVETPAHSTDLEATADGYVSVTPLHLDLTHYESMDALARLYGK